ncbi:MAG: hypothetical protein U0Q55_10105 [Vicinamibacterales bacterium]
MNETSRRITPVRSAAQSGPPNDIEVTTCPRCGETRELAKVKGCIKCLSCSFKFDCNGW